MGRRLLQIRNESVEVEEAWLRRVESRCGASAYAVNEEARAPSLSVLPARALPAPGTGLDEREPEAAYSVSGSRIDVLLSDSVLAAEAALKLAFQAAFLRQGAVLLHAAGVAFEGRGLVALGPSGAGKSTLAHLCHLEGADVLSDESVAVHPDGWAWGTPFRSHLGVPGNAREARLARLVVLHQGPSEEVKRLGASEAMKLLLSQAYRPHPALMGASVLLEWAAALLGSVGLFQLTFRKHREAGGFVRSFLAQADV